MEFYKRREFIKLTATAMGGLSVIHPSYGLSSLQKIVPEGRRIGIIGLDTSHSVAFTNLSW